MIRRWSWITLFRVRGTEFRAHIVLVVLGALYLLARPAARDVVALCLPVSILAHELGHAWVARRRRQTVTSVDVGPLWGFCRYVGYHDPFDRALIAWGGVTVNLAIVIVAGSANALLATPTGSWLDSLLGQLWAWNLMLFAINVLPVRPLDGAEAWRLVPMLWRRRRARRARVTATKPKRRGDVSYLRAVDDGDEEGQEARRRAGGPTLH